MKQVWLSWSSGKDSTWALRELRRRADIEVVGLLTTFNEEAERVAMHAVRRELARAQAASLGLPLIEVDLPVPCSNEDYEARMRTACERAVAAGVQAIAFGDLFLEDVRAYRERQLAETPLDPIFPLWGLETGALSRDMVAAGLKATLTCVDPKQIDRSFAGRAYDANLLNELPPKADPCGENGEFHTFVHDGPGFAHPLAIEVGEVVERGGFVYADVLPAGSKTELGADPA